ncbi:MAG: sulfite exporter TauE/SafE family protein [Nitrospirota bacterium]
MDFLNVLFPVSGVQTNLFVPPLVAMTISFFTSMAGISGAFLLLPFQMSVLHYTTPSVSGTNHVFNVVAIPSGVYRYIKEGRMAWPLTWVVIAGTLPGVFLGYYLRVLYLPNPRAFKLFVGCVLLYIGLRLSKELAGKGKAKSAGNTALEEKFSRARGSQNASLASGIPSHAVVTTISVSLRRVEYEFWGERFSFPTVSMFMLALVVGIIGGAYGIGGGSIIAPFCVAVFHLPVYTIAGAALMGTFITSVAGALFFSLVPATGGVSAMPDWPLGILFGIGGFVGVYLGARAQKFVPQKTIKLILGFVILFLSIRYIVQYFQ